jgi:hypothetical protein
MSHITKRLAALLSVFAVAATVTTLPSRSVLAAESLYGETDYTVLYVLVGATALLGGVWLYLTLREPEKAAAAGRLAPNLSQPARFVIDDKSGLAMHDVPSVPALSLTAQAAQ